MSSAPTPSTPSATPASSGYASQVETQYYTWRGYRCAYDVLTCDLTSNSSATSAEPDSNQPAILLLHPIGVGLSRHFWQRFAQAWFNAGETIPLYNPDLLGNGESDMPHVAYYPADWAAQLEHFIRTVVRRPVILISQGALFPVAIALSQRPNSLELMQGLILAGPPAWSIMTTLSPTWQNRLLWRLFDSPLGQAFYRYARREQFLQSFSIKQLFDDAEDVDDNWLDMLQAGAADPASRHAVFSFLAGFWRQDYTEVMQRIPQPTLVVFGEDASSISRSGKKESPQDRMRDYLKHLPHVEGRFMSGRNVLPYERPVEFVQTISPFVHELSQAAPNPSANS